MDCLEVDLGHRALGGHGLPLPVLAAGIPVVPKPVAELSSRDGKLAAIRFADGSELPRAGLLVQAPLELRSELLDHIGLELTEHGTVAVESWGKTSVPRVWAAGDVAEPAPNITAAIATGSRAAASIVQSLLIGGFAK